MEAVELHVMSDAVAGKPRINGRNLLLEASLIDRRIAWCLHLLTFDIPGNCTNLDADDFSDITCLSLEEREQKLAALRDERKTLQHQIAKSLNG